MLSAHELQTKITTSDRAFGSKTFLPRRVVLVLQGVGDGHLPSGQIIAHKVHHMIAVFSLHDVCIAALTGRIEAPVVEGLNHIALADSAVQAAIILRAIRRFLHGQSSEAFLSCLARAPLLQQFLSLQLGVGAKLGLFLVIAFILRTQRTGRGLNQNMADIDGIILFPEAVVEHHHVIGGAALHHSGVPGGAGIVKEPL